MPRYDGSAVDDSAGGSFSLLPKGPHLLRIASIQERLTKNEEPMWAVKLITEDEKNWVWDNIVWSNNEKALKRVKQFLKCFNQYQEGDVDYKPFMFEGLVSKVEVDIGPITYGKNKGKDGNFIPFNGYHTYAPLEPQKENDEDLSV
jgi:hypothetical protein